MSTDWMSAETTYRRARKGDTYHLAGCKRARNTLPWSWAEDKSADEIESSHANGLHPCKVCLPDGPLRAEQEQG